MTIAMQTRVIVIGCFSLALSVSFAQWLTGSNGAIYYNGGNLGIGVTSPQSTLDVSGGLNLTGGIKPTSGNSLNLGFDPTNNVGYIQAVTYNVANRPLVLGGGQIEIATIPAGDVSSGNANVRMAVAGNGNVGIGTITPSQLLEVSSPSEQFVKVTNTGMTGSPFLEIGMNTGNNAALFQAGNGKDFKFYNGQYALTILGSNGNVGVGTTNPQYPLSVNGTIQAKEVIVNTGWADYVFDPRYRLKPLSEVASYIKENHHLPDMPTEVEVQDKGIGLAEMQVKMLAKIEELTIHLIQSEERNLKLEETDRELRERIVRLETASRKEKK